MLNFIKRIFKRTASLREVPSSIEEFLQQLRIKTDKPELYDQALTHGSFVKTQVKSNERLEFIGDAVLGAVIAEILYHYFPQKNEGKLSKMRSKLVSREALNELGILLEIPKYLKHKIGKNEFKDSNNYIGNAFEALIGAMYLDKGYQFTHKFVEQQVIETFMDLNELDSKIKDFKSHVIIWAQKNKKSFEYIVDKNGKGKDDERFLAKLLIDGQEIATGTGRNKKIAQQEASKNAIGKLEI